MSEFIVEDHEWGRRLVLHGAWTSAARKFMEAEDIRGLYLNHARGWWGRDVDFLEGVPNLTHLGILDFKIDDVAGIHFLPELEALEVSTYCKTPIQFESFPRLRICRLYWRRGSKSLFDNPGLEDLSLQRYQAKDCGDIGKLIGLKSLGVGNSRVPSLQGLEALTGLTTLELTNIRVLDVLGCGPGTDPA